MAANLTPQYLEAEAEYKKAKTAEERLAALRKMWTEIPKHKASEKMQAELKKKISDAKEEVEQEKKTPKKTGISYKIPKQGAGQYVIIGAPNVGKSRLLTRLTRATPEVAPYPFTTHEPTPGMMEWEDVKVQLIDTPPITADYLEPWLSSMVRSADAAILIVDVGDDDGPFAVEAVIERLAQTKTVLIGQPPADADPTIEHVKTMLAANKIDLPGAEDRLSVVKELYEAKFPIHVISAEHGQGMEDFRNAVYKFLNVIRVYTKKPGKPPDMNAPYSLPIGGTVLDLATLVHRDLATQLKSAKAWGTGVFDGQTVTRDHVLHDRDVVELHN